MVSPGAPVDESADRIELDGRLLVVEPRLYLLLNKPRGPISAARAQRGRQTVLDLLGETDARLYPAGRLDADTEGLLIITNDGELTLHLTHPRFGVEKVYQAEVEGRPTQDALDRLRKGVLLSDGPAGPARIRLLRSGEKASRVELTIHSGRKRQVRRMLEAVGHPVVSLTRTRVGPLTLGDLRPGQWRRLTPAEVARLRSAAEKGAASRTGSGDSRQKQSAQRD